MDKSKTFNSSASFECILHSMNVPVTLAEDMNVWRMYMQRCRAFYECLFKPWNIWGPSVESIKRLQSAPNAHVMNVFIVTNILERSSTNSRERLSNKMFFASSIRQRMPNGRVGDVYEQVTS